MEEVSVAVSSVDASRVLPRSAFNRLETPRIAAKSVRQDIVDVRNLRPVHGGHTRADDNARNLESIGENVEQLPRTLREMMHHLFDLDTGFASARPVTSSATTATESCEETRREPAQGNTQSRVLHSDDVRVALARP